MMENILIAIISGIPGYISIAYILYMRLKKTKKTVKAVGYSANYRLSKQAKSNSDVLIGTVKLSLLNDRDDSVVITDIVGTVHYDKERYDKNVELILKTTPHKLPYISAPPQKYDDVIPKVIKPHESIRIELQFEFLQVIANFLYRAIPAYFGGFIGENPFMVSDEQEYIRNWDYLPIALFITLHIDGRENIKTVVSLDKENPLGIYNQRGTYWSTDIAKIGRDIWEKKWDKKE